MAIPSLDMNGGRVFAEADAGLAEHLAPLPGGPWAVWRWAGLRGTGFPVGRLLSLAAPRCARAAEELNEKRDRESEADEAALSAARRSLSGDGGRSSQEKARRLVKSWMRSDGAGLDGREAAAVARLRQCRQEHAEARETFLKEFESGVRQVSESLREMARRNDFREAVAWQNRHALRTGIDALLRKGDGEARGSKLRQYEQLVALYTQRYCAKNDTIGFFGPVGWARFVPDGPAVRANVGPSLISRRNLYFESWCVDSLVEHFGQHKELLPWVAPRRSCAMYSEGGTVRLPLRKPLRVTPLEERLLAACDGRRTAKEIAAEMVSDPGVALYDAAEVYELLESLRTRGLIWWKFELRRDVRPELELRKAVARVGEERLRAPLEQALDELERAFLEVKGAAGDAEKIEESLGRLESVFNGLTGKAPTRAAGRNYAGRTLVYEDCVRGAGLELGPGLLDEIGPALGLVLTSARWLGYAVSRLYRKVLRGVYDSLVKSGGSREVDFVNLWAQGQHYFFETHEEVLALARAEVQKRWAKILNPAEGQSRLHFSSDALKEAVAKEFAVPGRLGTYARYHSPDILVAARDLDALAGGEYEVVLGELHACVNTLGWPLFIQQHPSPQELFSALDRDIPQPRLVPIVPKGLFGDVTRVFPALVSPKDYRLDLLTGPTDVSESKYVPSGDLIVGEEGGELVLRTRDGRLKFDLLEGLGSLLGMLASNQFKMLRAEGHLPRITVDRLVVCREAWNFPAAALEFAFLKGEAERYSEATRWRARSGLPRFVFAKYPCEEKPVYVDFDSPVFVELMAKMVRRSAASRDGRDSLTISEMLPTIDQSWLPDAQGGRYTCELRVVAVDLLEGAPRPDSDSPAARP